MEQALHRKILLVCLSYIGLVTIAGIGVMIFSDAGFSDFIVPSWCISMIFPLAAMLVSYFIASKEKQLIRKAAKYVSFVYPLVFAVSVFLIYGTDVSVLLYVIMIVIFIILTVLALLQIFVFSDPGWLTGTLVLFILLAICICLRPFRIPFSGAFLTMILMVFAWGLYMFGIRCLYLGGRNRYFKYASVIGSLIMTAFLMSILWKIQHWPLGDFLIISSHTSFIVGTVIVLLTLPSSGYLNWDLLHKRILKRLILPWLLIFTLLMIKYLLPEVDNVIWRQDIRKEIKGFGMKDYSIEVKNNLKQE